MILLELDDFDYWVDNSVTGSSGAEVFSPMFIYIIHWARENNKLDMCFSESTSFSENYLKLLRGEIEFPEFVNKVLDGKLSDRYFTPEIREFLYDYIEYDGYTTDLTKYYKLNLWELPHDLKKIDGFLDFINKSHTNYEKNKAINPDLAMFD